MVQRLFHDRPNVARNISSAAGIFLCTRRYGDTQQERANHQLEAATIAQAR